MKKLALFFSIGFLVFSCNKVDQNEFDQNASEEFEISQDENEIITTSEELDLLLVEAGINPAEASIDEKLNYLSDKIAKDFTAKSLERASKSSTNQIVCIAQVFNGTQYFTQTKVGTTTSGLTRAIVYRDERNENFVGCNSNVYLDGITIDGKVTARTDLGSCAYIEARSIAQYSGSPKTTVILGCDD